MKSDREQTPDPVSPASPTFFVFLLIILGAMILEQLKALSHNQAEIAGCVVITGYLLGRAYRSRGNKRSPK
jgi:hypothetical protein